MANIKVGVWLLTTAAGAATIISIGGYTRLKRAGLAMVEWKPTSLRRPGSEDAWEGEFERYK